MKQRHIEKAIRDLETSGTAAKLFAKALRDETHVIEITGVPYTPRHQALIAKRVERIKSMYDAPFVLVDTGLLVYMIIDKLCPLSEETVRVLDLILGDITYHRKGSMYVIEVDYLLPTALYIARKCEELTNGR